MTARWGLTDAQMAAFERGAVAAEEAKRLAVDSAQVAAPELVRTSLTPLGCTVEVVDGLVVVHSNDCLASAVDALVPLGLRVVVEHCEMDGEHLIVAGGAARRALTLESPCAPLPDRSVRSDGRKFSYWLTELVEREAAKR